VYLQHGCGCGGGLGVDPGGVHADDPHGLGGVLAGQIAGQRILRCCMGMVENDFAVRFTRQQASGTRVLRSRTATKHPTGTIV
jgi:hypothetical protein